MIKAITSVPVVRKALTGTMLVASLLGGAVSCSRPARTDGENKELRNNRSVDQICYEVNRYQTNRYNNMDSTVYKDYGTYLGSMLLQASIDGKYISYIPNSLYPEVYDPDDLNWKEKRAYADGVYTTLLPYANDYRNFTISKLQQDLYENKDGVPTAKECSDYLDRKLAGLDISMEDYNKCIKKIEDFKANQGKQDNHKFAEYLAYKQFIIDSVNTRAILHGLGYLKDPKIKARFEQDLYNPDENTGYSVKPLPYLFNE